MSLNAGILLRERRSPAPVRSADIGAKGMDQHHRNGVRSLGLKTCDVVAVASNRLRARRVRGRVLGGVGEAVMRLLTICVLLFMLSACGSTRGVVVGKRYVPSHYIILTQCFAAGKTTVCTPQQRYIADAWYLELEDCQGDKCETATIRVTKHVHDMVGVGEWHSANDSDE